MRKADNLQLPCAVVTKSGNRNFLEPSGACNGTPLPLLHINVALCYRDNHFAAREREAVVFTDLGVDLGYGGPVG